MSLSRKCNNCKDEDEEEEEEEDTDEEKKSWKGSLLYTKPQAYVQIQSGPCIKMKHCWKLLSELLTRAGTCS